MAREEIVALGFHRFVRERRDVARRPPAPRFFGLRIEFERDVRGPIALGYASHFGLGLFVPERKSVTGRSEKARARIRLPPGWAPLYHATPSKMITRRLDPYETIIHEGKLRDYILSSTHAVGRFKATFFHSLGVGGLASVSGGPATAAPGTRCRACRSKRLWKEIPDCRAAVRTSWPLRARRVNLDRAHWRGRRTPRHTVPGGDLMHLHPLECVVLTRDIAEHALKAGDVGAVVEVYEPDTVEVEFVTAAGRTQALVTLGVAEIRKLEPSDMIAVRPVAPAA